MKQDAEDVLKPLTYSPNVYKRWAKIAPPEANLTRAQYDFFKSDTDHSRHQQYWENKAYNHIPKSLFENKSRIWLDVGAGTGHFFMSLAPQNPDIDFIAIERCKMRGNRLVKKTQKSGLKNMTGIRGNAIPALMTVVPDSSIERIYILYPCPWPKNSQRKNRWYFHAVMPNLVRMLKPSGLIIWASDQEFYIKEADFVSRNKYNLETLNCGMIVPNSYNDLVSFPSGRTKFEQDFMSRGLPCFELISRLNEK